MLWHLLFWTSKRCQQRGRRSRGRRMTKSTRAALRPRTIAAVLHKSAVIGHRETRAGRRLDRAGRHGLFGPPVVVRMETREYISRIPLELERSWHVSATVEGLLPRNAEL